MWVPVCIIKHNGLKILCIFQLSHYLEVSINFRCPILYIRAEIPKQKGKKASGLLCKSKQLVNELQSDWRHSENLPWENYHNAHGFHFY